MPLLENRAPTELLKSEEAIQRVESENYIAMFPYDLELLDALRARPQTIAEVLSTMRAIEAICVDGDGLKWFNWLYRQVTQAVEGRTVAAGLADPAWLAELDVQFALLYFEALESALSGQSGPSCWHVLFSCRDQTAIARIQFALAGINAHINHDLPQAIVATCQVTSTVPQRSDGHYKDYTTLNATLDNLIESAKRTLHVRLLGDPLPAVSGLEDTIAAWSVSAARQAAWQNGELLWHLRDSPPLSSGFLDTLDGLTTLVGKALLVPAV